MIHCLGKYLKHTSEFLSPIKRINVDSQLDEGFLNSHSEIPGMQTIEIN